jgi:hypothetical protein
MPISLVQQGLIVQQEFAKLLMMGSRGRIEVAAPLTDDERRDYEIHVRGQYGFGLAVQVKSTLKLHQFGGNARYLRCSFPVRASRVVNDPLYWYFIAHLDPKMMRFTDPVFLVPSSELHKHAAPKRKGAFWTFIFVASVEAKTRDHWHRFRVDTLKLGSRVLEIMRDLRGRGKLARPSAEILSQPDSMWVQPKPRRTFPQRHGRAA